MCVKDVLRLRHNRNEMQRHHFCFDILEILGIFKLSDELSKREDIQRKNAQNLIQRSFRYNQKKNSVPRNFQEEK